LYARQIAVALHLVARVHRDAAEADLALERLVGPEEELLPRLPARVEGPRHLRAAERAVGEKAAVLARKRNSLRHALIDDVYAQLREPVDVAFARAEIAALDCVVEEPVDAVAVILIILGGVYSALRRDAVCPPRRILEAEALHAVAQLAQCCRGRAAGQPGSHNE